MRIGIDVDLTIVPTLEKWLKWYEEKTGHKVELPPGIGYDVNKYLSKHENPYEFWELEDLYDDIEPYKDAKYFIDKLSENHTIVFVSSVFGNHYDSKKRFIEKYFPYAHFIATDSKWLVDVDILIDDKIETIDEFYENNKDRRKVYGFYYPTLINNFFGLRWEEIYKNIEEEKCVRL